MICLKSLLALIFIFFVQTMLCLPVVAQDTKSMAKFHCPYCGMVNLVTSKFCGACGSKLPQALSPSTRQSLRLASMGMPGTIMINDDIGAKILYDDEVVQRYRRQGSIAWPIAGGILAGAAGFLVGGFGGAACSATSNADFSGIGGFIVGAPIGEAICMPIGVHLANGRRGNFPLVFLASLGIAGTGIGLTLAQHDYRTPVFMLPLTALTQLIACVAIERTTGHSR